MKWLSTTLFTIILMLMPAAVLIERQNLTTWQNRLAIPVFKEEPNRHTPKHFTGTFLPPIIKTDTVLSAKNNPVILTAKTHILPGTTLTLNPGTNLYANENASLLISGHLISKGYKNQPVWFSSNEEHPLNQTWLGLSVISKGTATIENTIIEDASPAISCLEDSQVKISSTKLIRGSLGIFQTNANCKITGSFINGAKNGIIAIDTKPETKNTTINTRKKDIIIFSQ